MKRSLLLAGLLAAPVLLSAPRAQAQSLPYAFIGDAYTPETNGAAFVRLPVILSKPSASAVSIQWATQNGNAKAGSDYVASSGTVRFAPGQKAALIEVPVISDTIEEADEYFSVKLSGAQGATIIDSVGNAGISDDDYAGTISVSDVSGCEGNSGKTQFGFQITLSSPPLHALPVGYQTADGSAKTSSDYSFTAGVVLFEVGQQSKVVNVAVAGDTAVEADETFSFGLGAPGLTFSKAKATGTIVNDDTAPQNRTAPSGGSA